MDGLIVVACLLAGALLGAVATYFLLSGNGSRSAERKAQKELDEYREQVAEHFAKTAGLVNRMTDSYKEVFEQLQVGAERLLDEEQLREKLGQEDGRTITLGRLGYRSSRLGHDSVHQPDPGLQSAAPDDEEETAPERAHEKDHRSS